MKKLVLCIVALTIVFGGIVFAAEKELKVFIWSEYMDEENMPKEFEKTTGIANSFWVRQFTLPDFNDCVTDIFDFSAFRVCRHAGHRSWRQRGVSAAWFGQF